MPAQSLSVLVIDDEAGVLDAVRIALRSTGWKVTATSEPRVGLAYVKSVFPDVVVCDVAMPELSGANLIKSMKADPTTAHIPIVLMTGIAEPHMFPDIPWTVFLAKPFGAEELREAIYSAAKSQPKPD